MVCNRCIMVVKQQLEASDIPYETVRLGEAILTAPLSPPKQTLLKDKLAEVGFELLDDKRSALITRIKALIIDSVHHNPDNAKKLSAMLTDELHMDYNYLSSLFSATEGVTIEKFAILQRIERVKELLVYDEMNLNEIAFEMGYSSVQHLSLQFKKTTGLTPSQFKKQRDIQRQSLDNL